MQLVKVHITKFQSIIDSTEFEIGDVTCLVGKNEAGKTALLKALYKLNPIIDSDSEFNVTDDYPRRAVTDYEADVEAGRQEPAKVVRAIFKLESEDIKSVEEVYGPECFVDDEPTVTLLKGYSNERSFDGLNVNEMAIIKHIVESSELPEEMAEELLKQKTAKEISEVIPDIDHEAVKDILPMLNNIAEHGAAHTIYNSSLRSRLPKFLYFNSYYQMKGHDNVEALKERVENNMLEDPDHPLLGLLELARLDLNELTDTRRTETLLAKLEAAENQLTEKVLKYWSQNKHLRMKFDIRPAHPDDPQGMTRGMNIWGRVHDTKHMVSTALGTRSRGFVWFFSFLAWYSQLRQQGENLILLLDEPGLFLHAKAQGDLLYYFEKELNPFNQVIYTTHSPFLIDSTRFDRVRIVQDLSIEADSDELLEELKGTRVTTNVLEATPDSLFPLQGALGYELFQTLFIGPNCLVVEGVSDLLYIQAMSAQLQSMGETGLNSDWTITPVGGSDKVATFASLIGAQNHLKVAVVVDYHKKDKQSIENLYKRKLLKRKKVLTYADFVSGEEADVEDMFEVEFYLKLVNGEFGTSISPGDLPEESPRVLDRIEEYFEKNPLPDNVNFNHYRPARYLAENISTLAKELTKEDFNRFQELFKTLNGLL